SIQETPCKCKNHLEREQYLRLVAHNNDKILTARLSESFHERKNHLAREAYALCTATETTEEAKQH
ncbi:1905_t:CDS:1, partial [Racocetra persica]